MGLTKNSTGKKAISEDLFSYNAWREYSLIGLAGNPNVGKSTIFNNLTGMHQHTGNWPGKTVSSAIGKVDSDGQKYMLADLPGTYSLLTHSKEEDVARDFICFARAEKIIVVCDATCLERNLNLCLQIIEMTDNVIVCVNLLDEAKRKGIHVDKEKLSALLGVPVIGVVGSKKKTLNCISEVIREENNEQRILPEYPGVIEECVETVIKSLDKYDFPFSKNWLSINLITNTMEINSKIKTYFGIDLFSDNDVVKSLEETEKILTRYGIDKESFCDKIARTSVRLAEKISKETVASDSYPSSDRKIDRILTGRFTGLPLMVLLLMFVFWITISGANFPSELLSRMFLSFEDVLEKFFHIIMLPDIVIDVLVSGVYRVLTWVVSVMLPPMAIFFPLFTFLEDLGYLPRVAFNLDNSFRKCNSCGKQALTICMGFGCNAAGVTGGRIIDSERERLIAILTNSFVPCNGRFPMLITIISVFFVVGSNNIGFLPSVYLTVLICFGVFITMVISKFLSKTFLKGVPSSFALELPPFRKPQIGKIIIRSIFDRTLFVLGRAVVVAAPAGFIIWIMGNVQVGDKTLFKICTDFLDPFARVFGLDGVILFAFVLGFPANEIVIPLTVMGYTFGNQLQQLSNIETLREIFLSKGWTIVTAICFLLFTLLHWPCSTTCITIYKETKSFKWTFLSVVIPTLCGLVMCFIVNMLSKIIMAI